MNIRYSSLTDTTDRVFVNDKFIGFVSRGKGNYVLNLDKILTDKGFNRTYVLDPETTAQVIKAISENNLT